MTRVLLIGSGAREHAIAHALSKSSDAEIYAAMSSRNPGIMKLSKNFTTIKITDAKSVCEYGKTIGAELAIVGPEAPLVEGVVDELLGIGVRCVGPTRALAALEGDKAFCRELLGKYQISGNPEYAIFTDPVPAEAYLKDIGPVAIKPAGLTGGKGVKVSGDDLPTKNSEIAYTNDVLRGGIGGMKRVIIEERLEGEEYSQQAFVDGNDVHFMPLVQDHKRAYEGDLGPNTGGMGSYSDRDHLLPFVSRRDLDKSSQIMRDVVRALREEIGQGYRGILYGQFMLAKGQHEEEPTPKLVEFNCRFGDPEAMNVLPLLSEETDFLEICENISAGTLKPRDVEFDQKATVCKYLVPSEYPGKVPPHQPISVDTQSVESEGAVLFYAAVDVKDNEIVTTASRTLGVVGISDNLVEAERTAEKATSHVKGPLRHRRDIGTPALIKRRIDHMHSLRASPILAEPMEAGLA